MENLTRKQIAPCPKCGTTSGWYEKRISKYIQMFEPNGEAIDASNIERIRGGARCFCLSCDKDITNQVQLAE